ncbi:hypothetical protein H7J51_08285 [Mycobacterium crocinum]|uniref:Uncharacterized protein n=1 Tax=Mycolicibacterium crocinum TaxID=388459 RepID=A0ABY3TS25_9MYCO|nr:hypothetical protein [Mycolicibacterium crocinum]MCV7215283.1 hypothetical protein [Mycolicibacterium crocinum]ULN44143.1 hypothetical protein MI149_14355 [Mycolicibacterium crocinum]
MNSGHLVGYVGGLAVALGVGAAVVVTAPTASADTPASSSSSHSSTARSARVPQRTNTVASKKPLPKRSVDAPMSSVTLLMTASGATESGRTKNVAAASAAPNSLSIVYDPNTDTTGVTVVDSVTNSPIGSTATLDGVVETQSVTADGKRTVITTTVHHYAPETYATELAVMNMTAGGQIGDTLSFANADVAVAPILAPDGTRASVTLYLQTTSQVGVALLDTTTGAQIGSTVALDGYPFVVPVWNATGTRVVVTLSQLGGDTTAVSVLDATAGAMTGPTALIIGSTRRTPTLTADGTRAVVTTTLDNPNGGGSTRVTLVDTTNGGQVGTSLRLPGKTGVSVVGVGRIALVATGSGFVSILDTRTAAATPPLPLAPPWGFDAGAFFQTPLGKALAPVVFFAGFLGIPILLFDVLPVILVVPAWIGEIVHQVRIAVERIV